MAGRVSLNIPASPAESQPPARIMSDIDILFSGQQQATTTRIFPPRGFHFIISDLVSPNAAQSPIQDGNCTFYILHGFPSDVFIDPYELNQRVQDRITPSFVGIWGETDLELPVAAVDPDRGSSILFGPFSPIIPAVPAIPASPGHLPYKSGPRTEMLQIDFPLHARYPLPRSTTVPFSGPTHAETHILVPALVHVCERPAHGDREGESELLDPQSRLPHTTSLITNILIYPLVH